VGGYKFRELSFSLAWPGEEYICIAPKLGLTTSAAKRSKSPGLDGNKTQLKRREQKFGLLIAAVRPLPGVLYGQSLPLIDYHAILQRARREPQ